jgi:hypothetical protein
VARRLELPIAAGGPGNLIGPYPALIKVQKHKLTNAPKAKMTVQAIYPIGPKRGQEIIAGTLKELSCRTLLGTAICFKRNGGPERTARIVKWQEGGAFPSENDR